MSSLRVKSALDSIAAGLRVARKRRRMTISDFAKRVGVSEGTIIRLEKGDPGVRLEVFVSAMHVLGQLDRLKKVIDIGGDDIGLLQEVEQLPQRIRRRSSRFQALGGNPAEGKAAKAVKPAPLPDDAEGEGF